jgi:hypothetical protein
MKKIAIFTALVLCVAANVFAAADIEMASTLTAATTGKSVWASKTTAVAGTGLIGKSSSGVGVGMLTSSTGYALITQHVSGTKAYGSSYDSTSIYSTDVTEKGKPELAVPTEITTKDFLTWTSM